MARQIDLDQLMKYPLRRGSEHCDEKNADPRFLNGVESILEWAQTLPTLTPQSEWVSKEQLWEMDGVPIWVVDTSINRSEWCYWKDGLAYSCEAHPEYYDPDDYGHWLAYSRPPEGEA